MNAFSKILTGAAAVALASLFLAGPMGMGRKCPLNVARAEPVSPLVGAAPATSATSQAREF